MCGLLVLVFGVAFGPDIMTGFKGNTAQAACFLWVCDPVRGGYSTHILEQPQSERDTYAGLAASGGAGYIRDNISWASVEQSQGVYWWSETDPVVETAAKKNLKLLMLVGTTPSWASGVAKDSIPNWHWAPPQNPADYANFVAKVMQRYGKNGTFWTENPTLPKVVPVGIELWNEPNLAQFWGNQAPDPVKYTAMLKAGYQAVKASDTAMTVVSAGLSPQAGYNDIDCNGVADSGKNTTAFTGLNYFEQMYKNGAKGYFDAIGWHSYMYIQPTATKMMANQKCSGWSQMASTSPSVQSFMSNYGDAAKKIWVTETGAPSCVAGATYPCLSETEQANLASQQMNLFKTYSWAGLYFWYDVRDDYGGASLSDGEQHYGAVRANNTAKPVYSTIKIGFGK